MREISGDGHGKERTQPTNKDGRPRRVCHTIRCGLWRARDLKDTGPRVLVGKEEGREGYSHWAAWEKTPSGLGDARHSRAPLGSRGYMLTRQLCGATTASTWGEGKNVVRATSCRDWSPCGSFFLLSVLSSPHLKDVPLEMERQLQSRKGSLEGRSLGLWVAAGGCRAADCVRDTGDFRRARPTPGEVHWEPFQAAAEPGRWD